MKSEIYVLPLTAKQLSLWLFKKFIKRWQN